MNLFTKLKFINSRKLSNYDIAEDILPDCILKNVHPESKDIYPPKFTIPHNKIVQYVLGEELEEKYVEKPKDTYSDTIKKILDRKTKFSLAAIAKISSDIYYEEENWECVNAEQIEIANKLYPDIDLEGTRVKKSPFTSIVKSGVFHESAFYRKATVYGIMDRQTAFFSLQKECCKTGVIDHSSLSSKPPNFTDLSPTSYLNPELKYKLWKNPMLKYDSMQNFEMFYRSQKSFYKNDWYKIFARFGEKSLFFDNPVIKCLVNFSEETVNNENGKIVSHLLVDRDEEEREFREFEENLNFIIRRIPFITKWEDVDLTSLIEACAPIASQRQCLEMLYSGFIITNMLIFKNKRVFSKHMKDVLQLLYALPSIHHLVHFNVKSYEISHQNDSVNFKFNYVPQVPLITSISAKDLKPFTHSCEELLNRSEVAINDNFEIVPEIKEIDHIYMYLQNKLGQFLTKYCKQFVKNYRKYKPNLYRFLSKRFRFKKSLRNVMMAETYMLSRKLRRTMTKRSSKSASFEALSNDAILTYCLNNRKNRKLEISQALYKSLCENNMTPGKNLIQPKFYEDINHFFEKEFPKLFRKYILQVSEKNAKLARSRLFVFVSCTPYGKNKSRKSSIFVPRRKVKTKEEEVDEKD